MKEALQNLLNCEIKNLNFFTNGQIGPIFSAFLNGKKILIKQDGKKSGFLKTEAKMLNDLKNLGINVPKIYASNNEFLVLEFIESKDFNEVLVAKELIKLHSISNDAEMFGYYYDTPLAKFMQKNEQTTKNFIFFYINFRVLPLAKVCFNLKLIDKNILNKIEFLANKAYFLFDVLSIKPSLIHGDLWRGNVICNDKAYLIDPAIYFADKEMELAFIDYFNTFGNRFYFEYFKVFKLSKEYEEIKKPLYQIYPILVHIALYGGSYVNDLKERLKKLV